MKFSRLKVS